MKRLPGGRGTRASQSRYGGESGFTNRWESFLLDLLSRRLLGGTDDATDRLAERTLSAATP